MKQIEVGIKVNAEQATALGALIDKATKSVNENGKTISKTHPEWTKVINVITKVANATSMIGKVGVEVLKVFEYTTKGILNGLTKITTYIGTGVLRGIRATAGAIDNLNKNALQPMIKLTTTIGSVTTNTLDSVSDSFNKVAVNAAILQNPFVTTTASITSLGLSITALGFKLKALYAAIVLGVKGATAIAAGFNVVKNQVVSVINYAFNQLQIALNIVNNLLRNMVKETEGTSKIVTIMQSIKEAFVKAYIGCINLYHNIEIVSLNVDKLTISLLKLNAAWDKDAAAMAKYDQQLMITNRLIQNAKDNKIAPYKPNEHGFGPEDFKNVDKVINKIKDMGSKTFPKLKNDIKNASSTIKSSFTEIKDTVTGVANEFYRFDVGVLRSFGSLFKLMDKNKSKLSDTSSFVVKNFNAIGLAAAAVAAAVLYSFKAFDLANQADDLDDVAARLNMNAQTIQTWGHMFELAGMKVEDFAPAIDSLVRKAEEGSDVFNRLGISIKDSNGEIKSTEQLFNETVTALAGIENKTLRSAIAMAIFGKIGGRLNGILGNNVEELEANKKKYSELNTISQNAINLGTKLNNSLYEIKKSFEAGLNTALEPFLNRFSHLVEVIKNSNIKETLGGALLGVYGIAVGLVALIAKLAEIIIFTSNAINVLANSVSVTLSGVIELASKLPFISKEFKTFAKELLEISKEDTKNSVKDLSDNFLRLFEQDPNKLIESLKDATKNTNDLNDATKETANVTKNASNGFADYLTNLRATLMERTLEGRLQLIEEEKTEKLRLAAQEKASALQINRIKYFYQLKRDAEIKAEEDAAVEKDRLFQDQEYSWYKFKLDNQKDSIEKSEALLDLQYLDEINKQKALLDQKIIGEEVYAQRVLEIEEALANAKNNLLIKDEQTAKEAFQKNLDLWSNYGDKAYNIAKGFADVSIGKKTEEVDKWYDGEYKKLDATVMTSRRRAQEEERIENEKTEKMKAIKRQEKKWAISEALIQGALGVANVWGTWAELPVVAAALSALEAGVVGGQIALIQAQNFRNSGIVGGASGATEGRDTVTVGARPGEMFLNGRDQRNLMSMIKGNKSTGGQSINIQQGDIVIQGGANQSAIDQIKAETQRFSNLVKETVLDLQYRRQLSFA